MIGSALRKMLPSKETGTPSKSNSSKKGRTSNGFQTELEAKRKQWKANRASGVPPDNYVATTSEVGGFNKVLNVAGRKVNADDKSVTYGEVRVQVLENPDSLEKVHAKTLQIKPQSSLDPKTQPNGDPIDLQNTENYVDGGRTRDFGPIRKFDTTTRQNLSKTSTENMHVPGGGTKTRPEVLHRFPCFAAAHLGS